MCRSGAATLAVDVVRRIGQAVDRPWEVSGEGIESVGEVIKVGAEKVPVHGQGERNGPVAHDGLDRLRCRSGGDHRSDRRVPEDMESLVWESESLERRSPDTAVEGSVAQRT